MKHPLNDKQIKALLNGKKVGKHRIDNSLYLRINKEGEGFWIFRYTFFDKRHEITFGTYGQKPLVKANSEIDDYKAQVRKGINPLAERFREDSVIYKTVNDLAEDWLKVCDKRLKNPQIPRRVYRKEISPFIGILPITQVNPRDIRAIIQKVAASDRPAIANDTLLLCKKIFRHGIKLDLLTSNPADAFDVMDAGGIEKSRERFLSVEEIIHVFDVFRIYNKQLTRENYLAVALYLLLGLRKTEILKATWSEFDFDKKAWSIPAGRTKTDKSIVVPLSELTLEILKELHVRACGSEFVFPAKKRGTKSAHMSESTINAAINKLFAEEKLNIKHFTVHDLRRTSRSLLAQLGIPSHVAERCLNHKIKGVEGIYDRYDYFEERKQAQEKLANLLEPIIKPTNKNY